MSGVRNYFDENPYSENIGQAVGGATGLISMYGQISETVQAAKDVQYDIPSVMPNNPYEAPTYNLGQAWQQNSAFDPNSAGDGMVGSAALQGAGAGAAIGSAFSPLGAAIGAGAGALVGTVSGLFGKSKAEKEAAKSKERELAELKEAQGDYNTQLTSYDETNDAKDRYNKRLQNRRRTINRVIG